MSDVPLPIQELARDGIEELIDLLAGVLPDAIGGPMLDYREALSAVGVGALVQLLERARKVTVEAGPGVPITVRITELP